MSDFSKDPSWVAVYDFPVDDLVRDMSGKGNHLTNVGAVYNGGADFERSESDYMYRADADLSAGFPGKAGYTDLALYAEFTLESLPDTGQHLSVGTMKGTGVGSWWISVYNNAGTYKVYFIIGYDAGASWEYKQIYSGAISAGVRYALGVSFDDSEKTGYFKLIDTDASATLSDSTFSSTNGMSPISGSFYVGSYNGSSYHFDGKIHFLAIANTPKTEADFDAMAAGTYGEISESFEVDWDGDGSWDHANTDITGDVVKWQCSQGRSSDVDYDRAGTLSLTLRNGTGKYNSGNSSSPLYGLLDLDRQIRIRKTVSGVTATIWQGDLKKITPIPANPVTTSTATLSAYGVLARLTDTKANIALQETIKAGDAVEALLTGAGYAAGEMDIDDGLTTIAKWYLEDASRLSSIREMQDMEFGRFRESRDAKYVFDARDAIHSSPHATAQATYGTGLLYFKSITEDNSGSGVFNAVRARCKTLAITPIVALSTVIDIEKGIGADPLRIPAGATRVVDIRLPADSYYKSVSDWTSCTFLANSAADGTGTDLTASVTKTESDKGSYLRVTLANASASAAYITQLIGYGYGIADGDSLTITSDDATSQGKYDEKIYPRIGNWFIDPNHAQLHADHAVALFKNPRKPLQFSIYSDYDLNHALESQSREIGDRIHVTTSTDTGLYIDADFIVDSISHSGAYNQLSIMTVTCTPAPTDTLAATGGAYTFRNLSPDVYTPEVMSDYDTGNPSGASGLTIHIDEGMMWFSMNRPTSNYKGIKYVQVSLGATATHHSPYAASKAAYASDVLKTATETIEAGKYSYSIQSGTPNLFKGKVMLIHGAGDAYLDGNVLNGDSGSFINLGQPFTRSGSFTYEVVEPFYTQNAWDRTFEFPANFDNDIEDLVWTTKPEPIIVGTWYAQAFFRNKFGCSATILTSAQTVVAHTRTGATHRTAASGARVQVDPTNGFRGINSSGDALVSVEVTGHGRMRSALTGARTDVSTDNGVRGLDASGNVLSSISNSTGKATLKTSHTGDRVELDPTNGLRSINSAGGVPVTISPTAFGLWTATGSVATVRFETTNGLRGYDASANLLSEISGSTGKATIKSALTGARVEYDQTNGIRGYDSGGNVISQYTAAGQNKVKKLYSYDYLSTIDMTESNIIYIDTNTSTGGTLRIADGGGSILVTAVATDHTGGQDLVFSVSSTNQVEINVGLAGFVMDSGGVTVDGNIDVTSGDFRVLTNGKGIVLKNAAGTVTKRVRLNDAGDGLIFETP